MAVGQVGVDRDIEVLSMQFTSTMQFPGVNSVDELRKHGRELLTHAAPLA